MGIFDKFSKTAETSDRQADPSLRTHYYKATMSQAEQAIQHLIHAKQWELTLNNTEYHEYTMQVDKGTEVTVNLYTVSVLETAIDLYANSNKMFGYSQKLIHEIYQYLDQHLTVK
ncbi:MAG: hypothetical protein ACRC6H_04200 [Culicoidibacterales bacterium]